ncbi:MAG: hypothetical protein J6A79_10855 [Clostridia bacterium]|nr:hypothetical protein [Clostridia bacterium]
MILTLAVLYTGEMIYKSLVHQQMIEYSIASARDDGASNRVVMNGQSGYLGYSTLQLTYLTDGWIKLAGDNSTDSSGWKKISTFTLEPGAYTLTGMRGQNGNTIALQLHIEDDTGFYRYLYQYDEDVIFSIERPVTATLHVRVYPGVEGVDVIARPAVYRNE